MSRAAHILRIAIITSLFTMLLKNFTLLTSFIRTTLHNLGQKPIFRDHNQPYAEAMHYPQADQLSMKVLWLHGVALFILVFFNAHLQTPLQLPSPFGWRVLSDVEGMAALAIGLIVIIAPMLLYRRIANHFLWTLVLAICLITFSYLFVFVSGGAIEMHFHFFIVMAYMSLYADWRISWFIFGWVAFNHLVMSTFWPNALYFYGRNDLSPLVHLPFIFIMAIFTTILNRNYQASVIALTSAKKRNDEFLAIASHELKTPLTSMKGYVEVMERRFKRTSDKGMLTYIDKMDDQLNKIIGLVRDLLDISRIQSGQMQFNQEMVSIEALVEKAVEEVQALSRKHQIEVVGNQRVLVCGDRIRLSQLLVNLLSNAIKYSPEADKVVVTIKSARDRVVVEIQDFGIGISLTERQKVFEPYFRGRAQQREDVPGGLGMGLYICNEIIRRHNGRLWFESVPGEGSTFSFLLPLPRPGQEQCP